MLSKPMHRQVLLLASAQALFQIVSVIVMTVGGLAGARLASAPQWATLPIATMFLGTALVTFPAAMWMAKAGRRIGFICGSLLGLAGGCIAALGIAQQSMALLATGTFLVGAYQAFAQFYRFAASEVADEAFRPRAISLVMAGGIVAALVGPSLARLGGPIFAAEYQGSFIILAVVALVAAGLLMGLKMPSTPIAETDGQPGRRWQEIVFQPAYLVALLGAATGYGIMILAMTATPIAMVKHHHELANAATVIQLHVLGMFLPSFFTGSLIARLGAIRIMLAGAVIFIGHILMTTTGTGFGSFAAALVMLGVGWNFMYVGGTALLTTTYTPFERARAQAINDMTIFIVGLSCSFSAGGLLDTLGWQKMNLALIPWLLAAALALAWLGWRRRGAANLSNS
ncbi:MULTISPECIES: MFS transporter [Stenotrophomonas]|jgi:MFS family permease|uniref:MFS transporter n=1 Tax=Stenotrophomonas TaxID=40323 RepID=UPI00038F6191|nr:MFS transporter [Stenotrophomonas maltophilia]EQM88088.1 MFS transporter [Stenotrophomonas maltophilia MF89]OHY71876.1 MFS transporter [Stenotrophomonas maltophilia]